MAVGYAEYDDPVTGMVKRRLRSVAYPDEHTGDPGWSSGFAPTPGPAPFPTQTPVTPPVRTPPPVRVNPPAPPIVPPLEPPPVTDPPGGPAIPPFHPPPPGIDPALPPPVPPHLPPPGTDPAALIRGRIQQGITAGPFARTASNTSAAAPAPDYTPTEPPPPVPPAQTAPPTPAPPGPNAPPNPDQGYPAPTAPPTPQPQGRNDEAYIDGVIANWMATNNPRGHQDAAYWKRRILETGGLGPDNLGYWQGRFTEAEGTHPSETPAATPAGPSAAPSGAQGGSDAYSQFLAQLQSQQAAQQAQKAAVRAMLMERLKAAGIPVNESDANISQPLAAARDETQRSQQTERTALAERLYAQGGGALDSNALTQQIQQSAERNAGGLSQLRAGLISKAYDDKRNELQAYLQMALASGDTESAQLLQAQIAALSAAVQREGLGVNLAEFMANLNQRTTLAGLTGG